MTELVVEIARRRKPTGRVAPDVRGFVRACVLAGLGTALLCLPALHFRVDVATTRDVALDLACTAAYVAALALLVLGWRAATGAHPSLRTALAGGALVHLIALCAPPFLSLDLLCYAAIGRAMAWFHASPYRPLVESLPAGDPFLTRLPALWRTQGSAYSPLFNQLVAALARGSGDRLPRMLHLLQLTAGAAIFATAWLTGRAVGVRRPERAGQAAAVILFCPLAIVDGTVNAHNDALVAVLVAAFALAVELRRRNRAVAALLLAPAVKLSALLLVVYRGSELVARRLRGRLSPRVCLTAFAVAAAGGAVAALFARSHVPGMALMLSLVGAPTDAPHCTRSIECIPRALLFWKLDAARAAWLVGLAVRLAGGAWLIVAGWRAAAEDDGRATLRWAALALFVYYLALHGYMQSWYLLSLLPLLPFADERTRRAIAAFSVTALVYYAIRLPFGDDPRPWVVAARELAEGLVLILPAAFAWWMPARREPVAARRALAA